jgi:phospholipase C
LNSTVKRKLGKMKAITIGAAIAATLTLADAASTKKHASSNASGLSKIKHMVYFMQENRSFDHYYGTMSGVRNFADPNVGVQSKQPLLSA